MCRPRRPSRVKAIQWSHAVMYFAAARPNSHPMTGVRPSMVPKITPARSASGKRGLCMAAPLPTAAAKASVDIAMPRRKIAIGCMKCFLGDNGSMTAVADSAHCVHAPRPALEHAVAHFLSPARQHEGMDVEGVGHRLNLDSRHVAELHSRQFEFNAVAMNLLEAWLAHSTSPSVS